jgi:putative membrane protein
MLRQLKTFILRLCVNAGALWLAAFIGLISYGDNWVNLIIAALILGILNALIKPLLVIFTLPAIVLTLGLFTIFINGFIIVLVSWLFDKFTVGSFWSAMLVGLLIGLVNYIVTILIEKLGSTRE